MVLVQVPCWLRWARGERGWYFSRAFNKAERHYCVTRRELLAVVSAVRHFKYYLGGLHFTVRTDQSALQWLMSFREPEGQLAHWIEELQAYDFTVMHRPLSAPVHRWLPLL